MKLCFGSPPKAYRCKIILLDETELIQEIKNGYKGQDILDIVYKHLGLLETAYFGLRYVNSKGYSCWLESSKNVIKQIKTIEPITFYFGVKFYASDACKLVEECTRYQFFLQIKQDIQQSRLSITNELAAQLLAYIIQSELGDYDPKTHQFGYVSEFRLIVNQSIEFENKVCDLHKKLIGQIPAAVEMQFLERVKWLDLYGCELHSVIADDANEYFLGLGPHGIVVLKNRFKVGNYFWPRIVKVIRKGKFFMIKVIDKNNEANTYGFEMTNKHASKQIYKSCKEHQEFFKLTQNESKHGQSTLSRQPPVATTASIDRPVPSLVRVPSRRYQRMGRPDGSEGNKPDPVRDCSYMEIKSSILLNGMARYNSTPSLQKCGSLNPTYTSPYAPYPNRGLFSKSASASPLSVRSAFVSRYDYGRNNYVSHMKRNTSTSSLQRLKPNSGRISDNESEVSRYSRCSKHSHRKCHHHHHRHRQSEDSGTESDSSKKRKSKRKLHACREQPKLIDWNEILEKRKADDLAGGIGGETVKQSSAVVRNVSRYLHSSLDSGSESPHNDYPRYPADSNGCVVRNGQPVVADRKRYFPPEVKRYIHHQPVDISNLTETERKDIHLTKIESEGKVYKLCQNGGGGGGGNHYRLKKVDGNGTRHLNDIGLPTRNGFHDSYNKQPPPYRQYNGHHNGFMANGFYPEYSTGSNQTTAVSSAPRVTFQSTHSTAYYSTNDIHQPNGLMSSDHKRQPSSLQPPSAPAPPSSVTAAVPLGNGTLVGKSHEMSTEL